MLIHSLPYPSLIRCTSPNWKLSSSSLKCTYFIRLSTLSFSVNFVESWSQSYAPIFYLLEHCSWLQTFIIDIAIENFQINKLFFIFLQLTVPPLVILALGSTLSNDDIKEGDDVYFECHVQANPKFTKLSWLHNVSGFMSFSYFYY